MSDQNRASNAGVPPAREQLATRVSQLFGDERARTDEAEIDAIAAAVERVRRLRPPEFSALDPVERG